jgi:hypothetical protein
MSYVTSKKCKKRLGGGGDLSDTQIDDIAHVYNWLKKSENEIKEDTIDIILDKMLQSKKNNINRRNILLCIIKVLIDFLINKEKTNFFVPSDLVILLDVIKNRVYRDTLIKNKYNIISPPPNSSNKEYLKKKI